jgi:hypothetical protein
MKKLLVIPVALIALHLSAQVKLEGNKEGVYRIDEDAQEWVPSKIAAEPEAIKYLDKFFQAISNPGEKILVEMSEKRLRLKLPFRREVEFKKSFIFYNTQTNNIEYAEDDPVLKEEPSYLILFSITSILLMVIFNILFKKGYLGVAAFAAAFAAAAAALAVFAAAAAAAAALAVFAAAAAFAAALAVFAAFAVDDGEDGQQLLATVFYILMATHIVLLFI